MASRKLLKLDGRDRFYPVHDEKTEGDALLRLPLMNEDSGAVGDGGTPHTFMKEAAERAEALKADLEADIRDAQAARSQKLLGPFNPSLRQVLVRRLLKSLPEQSDEVIARETCLAGNLIEINRQVVT